MVFHRSLSDSKFPWVFRTLLSILADLNSDVFCIHTILTLTSYSFRVLFQDLGDGANAPTTIGNTINLMFDSFFLSSGKIQVFVDLFAYFHFVVHWNSKIHKLTSFSSC